MSDPISNSIPRPSRLKQADWVAGVVLAGTLLILLGLVGRVAWLQTHVTRGDVVALKSQHQVAVSVMARRASIYTADSTLVAGSVRMYNLFADPGYIFEPKGDLNALSGVELKKSQRIMARAMGELLDENPHNFLAWLHSRLYYPAGGLCRFVWLKRMASRRFYDRYEKIKDHLIHVSRLAMRRGNTAREMEYYHALGGIGFIRTTKRVYPLGDFAGQVIGFANSNHGLQGLESQLNSLLVGRDGRLAYVKDAAQRALWIKRHGYRPPSDGMRVWLTLNTVIQDAAQKNLDKACRHFKAHSGVAIIMDPFNGDILAMANYPELNPNDYIKTPPQFWRNRAVTDPYEPGSVFKPFNLGCAFLHHVVNLNDVFYCYHGYYVDPTGRVIKDVGGWGYLTVEKILVYSSNIGMTQIGWKMGRPMLYSGINSFGFGHFTGCILPGESPGIVRPLSEWTKNTLTSAAFGYGIAVTPLQLARAFCVFANGGYLPTPQVVKAVEVRRGHIETWPEIAGPQPMKKILPRHICHELIGAMEQVMIQGTGQYAISPYYQLYGKTGTANLAVAGGDGYHHHEYNATFICGGPAPDPRLICVVAVNRPDPALGHYGGTVAGPACSKMITAALRYLQVPPDQGPKTDPWWGRESELKKMKGLSH